MEQGSEGKLIYVATGPVAAVLLGMMLVPLREWTTAANLAFPFLALTIVLAEFGGRKAALATAITAGLCLDFFLTKPYMRLSIAEKHDVIAFLGLAACGLIAAACGSTRGRTSVALSIAKRDRELLRRSLRRIEEAGPVEDAITEILDAALDVLPLSAAVVRDDRGEIVALSGSAHELSAAGKLLRADSLLPFDGVASQLPPAGIPLPAGGGRLPLRESNRVVGTLDLWGTDAIADTEARRTLSDVGRVLSALLARGKRLLVVLVSIAACYGVSADEPEAPSKLDISGFVDAYYAYNANRPADHANFFPGVGTTAQRDNEMAINLAQVDFVLAPKPVGFHIALGYGNAVEVVHSGEVNGAGTSPDVWRNVVQASLQYQTKLGRGIAFEAGIYPSHIGYEAFAPKDNWNYTRGWLGELSPYYQTGVKAILPMNDRWTAQVHFLNGWQRIADNNRGKSLGWQLAYAADRVSFAFNGITGPELPDDDHDIRTLLDTIATYKLTPALSVGGSIDVAREEQPAGGNSSWEGVGVYARYAPPDARYAFAGRVEYFDDQDGAISGTAQDLGELTLTFEHRPVERLLLRVEGRFDRSSEPVFAGDQVDVSGSAVRDQDEQLLLLVAAIAKF